MRSSFLNKRKSDAVFNKIDKNTETVYLIKHKKCLLRFTWRIRVNEGTD